jgi:hypothetical protein
VSASARYRPHPDLRLTALEGEGVVLHLGTRRYFTVSETGLAILEALGTPRSLDEIVATLQERYHVTPEHARSSALAFLDRCLSAQLVTREEAPD